jgi:hypothetical protein
MSLIQTVRRTTFLTVLALAAAAAQACPELVDPASTSPGLGSLGLWNWLVSFF